MAFCLLIAAEVCGQVGFIGSESLNAGRVKQIRNEPAARAATEWVGMIIFGALHFERTLEVRQLNRSCNVARLSASATGLSCRQRSMRGKRTAIPLLCRLDRAMPSKPNSNTSVGVTLLTGPNF